MQATALNEAGQRQRLGGHEDQRLGHGFAGGGLLAGYIHHMRLTGGIEMGQRHAAPRI